MKRNSQRSSAGVYSYVIDYFNVSYVSAKKSATTIPDEPVIPPVELPILNYGFTNFLEDPSGPVPVSVPVFMLCSGLYKTSYNDHIEYDLAKTYIVQCATTNTYINDDNIFSSDAIINNINENDETTSKMYVHSEYDLNDKDIVSVYYTENSDILLNHSEIYDLNNSDTKSTFIYDKYCFPIDGIANSWITRNEFYVNNANKCIVSSYSTGKCFGEDVQLVVDTCYDNNVIKTGIAIDLSKETLSFISANDFVNINNCGIPIIANGSCIACKNNKYYFCDVDSTGNNITINGTTKSLQKWRSSGMYFVQDTIKIWSTVTEFDSVGVDEY